MLDIQCPSCGETYHVGPAHVGRSLKCSRCGTVFEIKTPQPAAASVSTSASVNANGTATIDSSVDGRTGTRTSSASAAWNAAAAGTVQGAWSGGTTSVAERAGPTSPTGTTGTAGTTGNATAGMGSGASSGRPVEVSDRDFRQTVLQSAQPVVVDFWAAWCGPCRAIAPAVEQLAQEYRGQVTFAKLNADENPRTMAQFGVQGIPTLIVFKGGREVERLVGLRPKAAIKQAVDQALAA